MLEEAATFGGMSSMASTSKRGSLPLLLKRTEVSLPLQRVLVQATAIKKRDIQLLEWAVLAPLATLDPPPSLEEIARELGIELVDFLSIVAEQLRTMGLIWQTGVNAYQITDIGRKFFAEGKVISDPRQFPLSIYYQANAKEWIYGFTGDINSVSSEDNYTDWDTPRPIVDASSIGLPEKIVTEHARIRRDLEKSESIAEYRIVGVSSCQIKINTNFLLKSDGIVIRPVAQPFGEENLQRVSAALTGEILGSSGLKQYFGEICDITKDIPSTMRVQPYELTDATVFASASEDRLVEHLIAKNPRYLIINRSDPPAVPDGAPPHLLITRGSGTVGRHDDKFIPNVIHFEIEGVLPEYAYITDTLAVRVVTVIDDRVEVPLFRVEEHRMQDEVTGALRRNLVDFSCLGARRELERALALFYLDPNAASFDEVLKTLTIQKQSREYAACDKLELLRSLLALKKLMSEPTCSQIEHEFAAGILKSLSWKALLEIDPAVFEAYPSCYIDAVNNALPLLSLRGELHQLLESYSSIISRLEKCTRGHADVVQQFKDSYLEAIARTFDQSVGVCSYEDIQCGMALCSETTDEKIKVKLAQSILARVIAANLQRNEKLQMLLKLSGMGIDLKPEHVEQIGKEMLHASAFNWFDPELCKKVQEVMNTCKSLNPYWEIGRDFIPPGLTASPQTTPDTVNLVSNLFGLHRFIPSLDTQMVSDVVQQASERLRKAGTPEKLYLWVELLAAVRPHEQKTGVQFIPVENAEIISTLRSLDVKILQKMRKNLELLSVYSDLIEKEESEQEEHIGKQPVLLPRGIVIDGSNVAHYGLDGKHASADQLMQAYRDLRDQGFDPIFIFVGAGLRHAVAKDAYKSMERYFQKIRKKTGRAIFNQAPAGTDDDHFIIQFAIDRNLLILTNDRYRDTIQKHPGMKDQIEARLMKYMFNPESNALMTSECPGSTRTSEQSEEA